jgi:hypothetical protein
MRAARSDAELYDVEGLREVEETKTMPEEEEKEIKGIFSHYGLSEQQSLPVVQALVAHQKAWVDFRRGGRAGRLPSRQTHQLSSNGHASGKPVEREALAGGRDGRRHGQNFTGQEHRAIAPASDHARDRPELANMRAGGGARPAQGFRHQHGQPRSVFDERKTRPHLRIKFPRDPDDLTAHNQAARRFGFGAAVGKGRMFVEIVAMKEFVRDVRADDRDNRIDHDSLL